MKLLLISDTHGFHKDLLIPEGVGMIIHAGDISNSRQPSFSANECIDFLEWYKNVPVHHKVLVAGNHDTAIEKRFIDKALIESYGITYLEHESCVIEGIKLFGSPYTPTFGVGWSFNVPRHKLESYWKEIPDDTDILITHGPPYGILDLSGDPYDSDKPQMAGCKALCNRVMEIKPLVHCFGHIHENGWCLNKGTRVFPGIITKFVNASCVTDRKFSFGLTSHGIVIKISSWEGKLAVHE